jgi:hypothetical protein
MDVLYKDTLSLKYGILKGLTSVKLERVVTMGKITLCLAGGPAMDCAPRRA